MTPEERAWVTIDQLLRHAGWDVHREDRIKFVLGFPPTILKHSFWSRIFLQPFVYSTYA